MGWGDSYVCLMRTLPRTSSIRLLAVVALVAALLGGCTAVPVAQQRLVSKSGMTFAASAEGGAAFNLTAQVEPGTAITGGAQNAGCTSCR